MKKHLSLLLFLVVFLCSMFTTQKIEAQGFNYQTTNTAEWVSTSKLCIVATCTTTSGSDCTMPGSKTRICIDFTIFF